MLPIEYYDDHTLYFIGNRIGKTVKVDRNTKSKEMGKYGRLYVQVNLTKSLIDMFSIKERHYKVEYEGLHILRMHCGRFGHHKERGEIKKIWSQLQATVMKEKNEKLERLTAKWKMVNGR